MSEATSSDLFEIARRAVEREEWIKRLGEDLRPHRIELRSVSMARDDKGPHRRACLRLPCGSYCTVRVAVNEGDGGTSAASRYYFLWRVARWVERGCPVTDAVTDLS